MYRPFALTALLAAVTACSSFGTDSPAGSADASTPSTSTDGGIDAAPTPAEAGTKAQLVQSTQRQTDTDALLTPFVITFETAPTPGNTAIVIVGTASGTLPTSVMIGATPLKKQEKADVHIETTAWTGPISAGLSKMVTVTWDLGDGPVHDPTVFIMEWSHLGDVAFAKDHSSRSTNPPEGPAQTDTVTADGSYSLVLAVAATQAPSGKPTDIHFSEVKGSGVGGNNVYLALAHTTDALPSYGVTWTDTETQGWDTLLLGFR